MSIIVNVHEAKTHLSRLLEQAEQGREVVIARAGRPVARLVPVAPVRERALGFLAGRGTIERDVKAGFADTIEAMFGR